MTKDNLTEREKGLMGVVARAVNEKAKARRDTLIKVAAYAYTLGSYGNAEGFKRLRQELKNMEVDGK